MMFEAAMRRAKKELKNREEIGDVLQRAQLIRLAMCLDNQPYVVPLNFGYDGRDLYFHTAPKGLKLDILRQNPRVCFEACATFELVKGATACKWGTNFESVVGFGQAVFLEDPAEKAKALEVLMKQYDPQGAHTFPPELVAKTTVIKIEVESLTGKRSPAPPEE